MKNYFLGLLLFTALLGSLLWSNDRYSSGFVQGQYVACSKMVAVLNNDYGNDYLTCELRVNNNVVITNGLTKKSYALDGEELE